MAEASSSGVLPATLRLHHSSVHTYYEQIEVTHPTTKLKVPGSLCKLCKSSFVHRITTNLKAHLRNKHQDAYAEVVRK